ncbi:MAG: Gfo/Idh/MocA family protein [Acidimicrobiales bacterium]
MSTVTPPAHTAVVLGLGSIGSRHARLLLERPQWRVLAVRRGEADHGTAEGVVEVRDLDAAVADGADVAFVCSPTYLHIQQAMAAADRGLHLFIEKPLSHGPAGLDELLDLVTAKDLRVLIGTMLRHHPLVISLARHLVGEPILHVRAECSSWLPEWRPDRDYRDVYRASQAQGGGVILDLIHEIDLVDHLVGPVTRIDGRAEHRSSLELHAPDHAELHIAAERSTAEVFLSWYAHIPQRWVTVYGERLTARLDLLAGGLTVAREGGTTDIERLPLDRDDLYRRQLDHLEAVLSGEPPIAPIETAARLVHLLEDGSLL